MYHDRAAIARLQETPITNYLRSLGIDPVRSSNGELIYRSPLTGEQTPSFFVHPQKNRFNCFSSGEKGDIIRLVTLLEKIPFKPALERLASIDRGQNLSFSFSGQSISQPELPTGERSALTLVDERALFNRVLMDYVISRGIPPMLAKRYLYEIHYRNGNREYYAVGFKTDKDSYALRSKLFKGWLGASAIRTISIAGSTTVDVFEGFFDFLAALAYNKQLCPECTTIILNSTTNLAQAIPVLEGAKRIHTHFDNDRAGRAAYEQLRSSNFPVYDRSGLYADYNDFNDMVRQCTIPSLV